MRPWMVALIVCTSLLVGTSTPAFAQMQGKDPLETKVEMRSASGIAHVPGLRYEYGLGDTAGRHTIGAGYMLAWESYSTFWIYSLLMRFGAGPDVKVVTESFDGVGGVLAYASGRAHFIGDNGGLGIEIAGGMGIEDRGTLGAMLFGIYYSTDYFEVGYAYQLPLLIDRPDWLGEHLISLRLHLPVFRTAKPKLESDQAKKDAEDANR